jgi:predicted AAA+ superfamily ATPase
MTQQVLAGGYPEMQQRTTPARRQAWARAYMTTLIERDIQDIAQIDQTSQVPQLLSIAAELSGQLGDFKGLRRLREIVGPQFVTGIVLYDGTKALPFGDGLWAVPLNQL